MGAEISLAAYEALVSIVRVFASTFFPRYLYVVEESEEMFSEAEGRPRLDFMCMSFVQNINNLLGSGVLARTRRAVLLDIKVPFFLLCRMAHIFVSILSDLWIVKLESKILYSFRLLLF